MTLNRRERMNDDGFTLIELIVVTAVLVIIIGALGTGVVTLFRTTGTVTDRMVVSHDEQLLNDWITADMQSTTSPLAPADTDINTPTGCSGTPGGRNVVRFTW